MTIRNLDKLFNPSSVVLVGASPRPGSVGYWTARNLLGAGFSGDIFLVNPKHREIDDHPCFGSISELPRAPDLGVIATPAPTVPGLIAELGERGAKAAVSITGGLTPDLKRRMLDAAQPHCLRILGPNCIGLQLPRIGINASFAHRHAPKGDIAFISQSGALVTAIVDWAADHGVGFSHVISSGDMTDVDFGDLLDYLAGDVASHSILIYMEALTNAPKFMSAIRRASRSKHVIIVKSGRSEVAAKAAMSHTGALAGSDEVYDAAFRRAGALRVYDLEQLFEAAGVLRAARGLAGERLAILTNGGGAGVLAADRLEELGGVAALLGDQTKAALDEVLPSTWSKGNPIDIIGDADAARYRNALEIISASDDCDAVLALYCPTALSSGSEIAQSVADIADRSEKPILTNWLGATAAETPRRIFADKDIATFDTPGSAVRAYMHLVNHRRAREELMQIPPAVVFDHPANCAAARTVIDAALATGRTVLSADESKQILAAYGVPVVTTVVVDDVAHIGDTAARLLEDHPALVLKIRSDDISHKSDAGGVVLSLETASEVAAAATAMLERLSASHPDANISGFTLEPMISRPHGHELLIGISVDTTFGPTITFGSGGVSVEVVNDAALSLLPIDARLAQDLIARTRVAKLLNGYRDRPSADLTAIGQTLLAVSALTLDIPEIRELDINPLVADENGVIAIDARIRIADEDGEPRQPLSIRPYPQQWQKEIDVPGLGPVLLRPIRPRDELLYNRFGELLETEHIRSRLFSTPKTLSHEFLARLTQIDYAREMAFVALEQRSGELLGISRLTADPDYERAEYAVITRSDIQGKGIGWQLMNHLIDYAKAEGLQELFGYVLSVNTTMLRMCRELGFTIELVPDDAAVKQVTLDLTAR